MMNVRAFALAGFGGLGALGLFLAGCGDTTGASGGPSAVSEGLSVSFNEDPGSTLIASAKAADGSELAIYGDKDASGQFTTISQIDVTGGDASDVTSVQLDENQRPVRMEAGTNANATFAYDDDAATVRVEVQDATGAAAVDEAFGVLASGDAGKPRPSKLAAKPSQSSLCDALSATRDVMEEFFNCEGSGSSALCVEAHARVPDLLRMLCESELREIGDLSTLLGENPQDIPLGIGAHFTTRAAADGGTTVVLVAVAFGGVQPHEPISWSLLAGPGDAAIEDLPGGVALADLLIPGRYTFRASVADADGQRASVDTEVSLDELPGVVIQYTPDLPEVGQVVEFSGSDTEPPAGDPIKFFHWRFGDGEANTGVSVSHAYTGDGEFTVSLLISTESGRRATATALIRVGSALNCENQCQMEADAAFLDCLLAGGFEDECAHRSGAVLEECFGERCDGTFDCARHCEQHAAQVLDECLNDGNSADECDLLAADVVTDCLREQCEQPLECEQTCHDQAEDLYFGCREDGKPEEDCASLSRAFMEDCIDENCEQPPDCDQRCQRRADRIFDECRRDGGNEEECAHRAREHAERCRQEDCFDPGNCEELCRDDAERVRVECLADGGTEDHCDGRSADFFDLCLQDQCDRPEDCERMCTDEADWWFERCVEDGGSDEECRGLAGDFRDICFREECKDQPDCEFLCYDGATRFFEECLFAGGDEEGCLDEAELHLENCLSDECDGQEHDCEEQCWNHSDEVFDRCLIGGGDEEICWIEAQHFVDACLFEECDQAPGCEQRCEDRAQEEYDACLSEGRPDDECSNESFDIFDGCLLDECDQEELPDCEQFCEEQGGWKFDECIAAGDPENECTRIARELVSACLQEECGFQGEPDCADFCADFADSAFDTCLVQGGTDDECAGMAGAALDGCMVDECGQELPPPDDCEASCDLRAQVVFEECMLGGGTDMECTDRQVNTLGICIAEDCHDTPPPPTDDCESLCMEEADFALEDCLLNGMGIDCDLLWEETFNLCLNQQCHDEPPPPPTDDCESLCMEEADFALEDCLLNGMGIDCDLLSEETFNLCLNQQCQDEPPPPPMDDCDTICLARADSAFDDCLLNGLDVDCDVLWEDTFNFCVAQECN